MFKPISTRTVSSADEPTKVLLYAHHGFGKTYQCRNYQKRFGKGLIISGEAGLKSVSDVEIDYIPFTSWDGQNDPENRAYSFRSIMRDISSPEFAQQGYQWIGLDSLTELSERLLEHLQAMYPDEKNAFKLWGDYDKLMTSALKWLRDRPMHVYVTALAKEEKNDTDGIEYWPFIKGQAVAKKVPAIFDHVFCGVRTTEKDPTTGIARVHRHLVTEEVMGWHGKARDPKRVLKPVEPGLDVTELLARMSN